MIPQTNNTEQALRRYCERIEALRDEVKAINESIRDVKREAKMEGFDLKTLGEMLKLRAMDIDDRQEFLHTRDVYEKALGLDHG